MDHVDRIPQLGSLASAIRQLNPSDGVGRATPKDNSASSSHAHNLPAHPLLSIERIIETHGGPDLFTHTDGNPKKGTQSTGEPIPNTIPVVK